MRAKDELGNDLTWLLAGIKTLRVRCFTRAPADMHEGREIPKQISRLFHIARMAKQTIILRLQILAMLIINIHNMNNIPMSRTSKNHNDIL